MVCVEDLHWRFGLGALRYLYEIEYSDLRVGDVYVRRDSMS